MARARTRTAVVGPAVVDEWGARLLARYPWLDDSDAKLDEHGRSGPVVVYAGTAEFFSVAGRWMVGEEGEVTAPGRSPRDPLWIVEVLVQAQETVGCGESVVRGAACRRWEFRVDPALYRVREGTGRSQRRPRRLGGYACIDDDGRLRRVTWTQLGRRRPRWPGKPATGPRAWQTIELWDFGVPVEIDVPTVEPERSARWPLAVIKITWKLWRHKRAYARRQPGA